MTQIKVHDKVKYHGSHEYLHGEVYHVVYIPSDPEGRGYTLISAERLNGSGSLLQNVHRDSFTKVDDADGS
jgi:hypothetical protein